jgi:hypothetical protein
LKTAATQSDAASAVAQAAPLSDPTMGRGRLDLVPALQSVSGGTGPPDFTVAAAPASATVTAGNSAIYTVTVAPTNGFSQTVTWNCTGAPTGSACSVSPASVTLDGTHAATATVTMTTLATASSSPLSPPRSPPPISILLVVTACFTFLVALFLFTARRHALGVPVRLCLRQRFRWWVRRRAGPRRAVFSNVEPDQRNRRYFFHRYGYSQRGSPRRRSRG